MLADVGRMQVGTVTGSDVGEPMIVPKLVVGPGCGRRGSDVGVTGLEGGVVGERDEGEMSVG